MTERPERPERVPDLDWDPKRARAFADGATDVWTELLERLPDLPVRRGWSTEEVREAVAIPVPDAPMPDDTCSRTCGRFSSSGRPTLGTRASSRTSRGRGRSRGPWPTCWRPA